MLEKRGTFHFIQKSKAKTSQPPGDFFVTVYPSGIIFMPTVKQADFFLYAQTSAPSLLGSRARALMDCAVVTGLGEGFQEAATA